MTQLSVFKAETAVFVRLALAWIFTKRHEATFTIHRAIWFHAKMVSQKEQARLVGRACKLRLSGGGRPGGQPRP